MGCYERDVEERMMTTTKRYTPPKQKTPEVEYEGDCFPVASNVALRTQGTDVRVVHGLPVGQGLVNKGKRYWHAWVEMEHPQFGTAQWAGRPAVCGWWDDNR